ncbi:phospholipase effector Tle1 domain-containing protein [Siccirubricoccus deserti]
MAWSATIRRQAGMIRALPPTPPRPRRRPPSRRVLETVGSRTGGQIAATFGRLRRLIEGATGIGITENIAQAYAEIVRQYRPGDRIYLIGFSRGAYTARCVAGVIGRCGLLRAEYGRYADDVVHLYRTRADPAQVVPVPRSMIHDPDEVRIEFLGLFDTVGSLGVPLWGWWFRVLPIWRNRSLSTDPMAICRYVYHAMAMDERRSQFFPTPFSRPKDTGTRLQQVWFRGAHGDVGGGYAETGLSDITLAWMVEAARRHGLRFNAWIDENRRPSAIARLHDELRRKPSWRLFGSWPRWHPVPGADEPADPAPPGTLHPSVLERMPHPPSAAGLPAPGARPAAGDRRGGRPGVGPHGDRAGPRHLPDHLSRRPLARRGGAALRPRRATGQGGQAAAPPLRLQPAPAGPALDAALRRGGASARMEAAGIRLVAAAAVSLLAGPRGAAGPDRLDRRRPPRRQAFRVPAQ